MALTKTMTKQFGRAWSLVSRFDWSAAASLTAVTAMLALAPVSASQGAELLMACEPDELTDSPTVNCDFRLTEPLQMEVLTLSANGKVLEGSKFSPYPGTGEKSAWLYLIDRSNPGRAPTVRRNVEFVSTQLRTASETRLIGLATFANDLNVVLQPAASHANLEQTLGAVKADGAATELFANSLKAIEILKNIKADRKALVIMSDGKAEDTAYAREDVVKAAKDAGVTIMGLGFARSASETPALQEIKRLTEETGGHFDFVVGDQPLPADISGQLPRYLENGGRISGPLGDISGDVVTTLTAKVTSGAEFKASETIKVAAAPVEIIPPLSLIGSIYTVFDGASSDASDWANANQALAWLVLLLPVLLLIIGLVLFLRNRNADGVEEVSDAVMDDAETPSTSKIDPIEGIDDDGATRHFATESEVSFGHFEIIGSEDHPFKIMTQSISIGRHSDNDLVLSNDSVHRHHAHFHISPDGTAAIHDLDTANGILVNGNRVNKVTLQSGDLIELGEVRLRFIAS